MWFVNVLLDCIFVVFAITLVVTVASAGIPPPRC